MTQNMENILDHKSPKLIKSNNRKGIYFQIFQQNEENIPTENKNLGFATGFGEYCLVIDATKHKSVSVDYILDENDNLVYDFGPMTEKCEHGYKKRNVDALELRKGYCIDVFKEGRYTCTFISGTVLKSDYIEIKPDGDLPVVCVFSVFEKNENIEKLCKNLNIPYFHNMTSELELRKKLKNMFVDNYDSTLESIIEKMPSLNI